MRFLSPSRASYRQACMLDRAASIEKLTLRQEQTEGNGFAPTTFLITRSQYQLSIERGSRMR